MHWLIKLFVRKRVLDFIQNYLDCPANWKLDDMRTNCLINKKHDLTIELSTNRKSVYRFHPATNSMNQDDLNVIERGLLIHTFKGPCDSAKDIPTKATHPEEFI